MLRTATSIALALAAAAVHGQQAAPTLYGQVQNGTYVSPTGTFKIPIPVLAELGGTITDTPSVVTFQDAFSLHLSIGAFKQDATQHWEMTMRGRKDYLAYFFTDFVLRDFKKAFPDVQAENDARFLPNLNDGTLITYVTIPGGSMFTERLVQIYQSKTPPLAKRGNMIFVKNGYTYVISTELAEKVTEGSAYTLTSDEEDTQLRERLLEIAGTLAFSKAVEPEGQTGK